MPEPTYDVYRPTRHPIPEPPVQHSEHSEHSERPPAYDHRPRRGVSHGPGIAIGGAFTPAIVCTVIWAMSGGGYFWPMWVFLAIVLMTGGGRAGGRGRRRHW